jgi:prepilin-type N-terminal cleavage/methylation domain-containing protein
MNKLPSRGFTLIELVTVVSMIGILAAVALPAYQDFTIRSRIAEAFVLAEPIQKTVRDYYDRWGVFPADNAEAGLYVAEYYIGQTVKSIRVEQGVISITLDEKICCENNHTLHLLPAINSASPTAPFAWVCEGTSPPAGMKTIAKIPEEHLTLPGKYLPAPCRS